MSRWPRIDITVDAIVLKEERDDYSVLLIKRKNEPYKNKWAFPGGFLDEGETLQEAAIRELKEETDVDIHELRQLHVFDDPNRDPRKRIISVPHYVVINHDVNIKASDDAEDVQWFRLDQLPSLAFDHQEMMDMLKKKLAID
ncbi:MAG: NUDIX hydrolase [Crocinitomicaceae bacterium]|nr:NUDIX hydrolase [Crocinitomicaceae bacterium]